MIKHSVKCILLFVSMCLCISMAEAQKKPAKKRSVQKRSTFKLFTQAIPGNANAS